MIDTHAHLQDEKYDNIDLIIQEANQAGVNKIVCAGASLKTSKKAVDIANKYDCVYATVGVHPEEAGDLPKDYLEQLTQMAKCNKVVAIGEIGLDYCYEFCSRETQKKVFIEQINLAHKLKLPVVIHTRDASGDTMDIIRENLDKLKNKTCIHCYSMSVEILKEIINYGFYISLGGVTTFKNARTSLDVLKECPLDRLMLETDCPYLTPEPHRGKLNYPKYIPIIAQKFAQVKNLSLEEINQITTQNANNFYGLNKNI